MDPFEVSSRRGDFIARRGLKHLSKGVRRNLLVAAIACAAAVFIVFTISGEQNGFAIVSGASAQDEQLHIEESRENASLSEESEKDEPTLCVAYVTGAVREPGLVFLEAPARIGDAVVAAGGFSDDAAIAAINLADHLHDGTHIHVPTNDEVATGAVAQAVQLPSSGSGTGSAGGSGGTGSSTGSGGFGTSSGTPGTSSPSATHGRVNINTADFVTLQTLSGIGPVTAQRIIDYRTAHGPFRSKEEIKNVTGIGEKRYEAIVDDISV